MTDPDNIDIANFYITCQGVNPFLVNLGRSYFWRTKLGNGIGNLYSPDFCGNNCPCPNNQYLKDSLMSLKAMFKRYQDIHSALECSAIHPIYKSTYEDALCTSFFEGSSILWLSVTVALIAMFCLAVCSVYVLHYFGKYWHLDSNNLNLKFLEIDYDEADRFIHGEEDNVLYVLEGRSSKNHKYELASDEDESEALKIE
jgi:hypothetical protein